MVRKQQAWELLPRPDDSRIVRPVGVKPVKPLKNQVWKRAPDEDQLARFTIER